MLNPLHMTPTHACCCACRRQKKLTEYEKWEYKQLMMSGVLDVREFPLFDEENGLGVLAQVDEVSTGAWCIVAWASTHMDTCPTSSLLTSSKPWCQWWRTPLLVLAWCTTRTRWRNDSLSVDVCWAAMQGYV